LARILASNNSADARADASASEHLNLVLLATVSVPEQSGGKKSRERHVLAPLR